MKIRRDAIQLAGNGSDFFFFFSLAKNAALDPDLQSFSKQDPRKMTMNPQRDPQIQIQDVKNLQIWIQIQGLIFSPKNKCFLRKQLKKKPWI